MVPALRVVRDKCVRYNMSCGGRLPVVPPPCLLLLRRVDGKSTLNILKPPLLGCSVSVAT